VVIIVLLLLIFDYRALSEPESFDFGGNQFGQREEGLEEEVLQKHGWG